MEPQQPAKALIVGSCVPPEPKTPQIASTTFEAEGVRLPPQELKELKAIAAERDDRRKKAMGDEEWHGLLDQAQHFFSGLVLPGWASPSAAPHLSQAPASLPPPRPS